MSVCQALVEPMPAPVTKPLEETVATEVELEDQVAVAVRFCVEASV